MVAQDLDISTKKRVEDALRAAEAELLTQLTCEVLKRTKLSPVAALQYAHMKPTRLIRQVRAAICEIEDER